MAGGSLLRTKSIDQSIQDTKDESDGLRRALGPLDLVVFGVAVIIGTGIFVLTGTAAGTLPRRPGIALRAAPAAERRLTRVAFLWRWCEPAPKRVTHTSA